ncbi:MAG: hypothetical protein FWJ90_03200 [Actinomadura sp.]
MANDVRAVEWTGGGLRLLDQAVPPGRVEYLDVRDVDTLVDAIRRLVVRGAHALGVAGAFGVAVAVLQAEREGWDEAGRDAAIARIREARPTAVNLAAGVDRVLPLVAGAAAFNPAFDVTPARLVTALVTETGVLEVSAGVTPGRSGRPS